MAQTLGRDVLMSSGSFTACRLTFGDQRHLLHMAPHPRAFFGQEATNGIDMQCIRSKALSILFTHLSNMGLMVALLAAAKRLCAPVTSSIRQLG